MEYLKQCFITKFSVFWNKHENYFVTFLAIFLDSLLFTSLAILCVRAPLKIWLAIIAVLLLISAIAGKVVEYIEE